VMGELIYSARRLAFPCAPRRERDVSRRLIEAQERAGGQRVASNRDSIRALARSLLPPPPPVPVPAAPLAFNYSGRRSRILPIDRALKSSAPYLARGRFDRHSRGWKKSSRSRSAFLREIKTGGES